jgi:hypothetical protein
VEDCGIHSKLTIQGCRGQRPPNLRKAAEVFDEDSISSLIRQACQKSRPLDCRSQADTYFNESSARSRLSRLGHCCDRCLLHCVPYVAIYTSLPCHGAITCVSTVPIISFVIRASPWQQTSMEPSIASFVHQVGPRSAQAMLVKQVRRMGTIPSPLGLEYAPSPNLQLNDCFVHAPLHLLEPVAEWWCGWCPCEWPFLGAYAHTINHGAVLYPYFTTLMQPRAPRLLPPYSNTKYYVLLCAWERAWCHVLALPRIIMSSYIRGPSVPVSGISGAKNPPAKKYRGRRCDAVGETAAFARLPAIMPQRAKAAKPCHASPRHQARHSVPRPPKCKKWQLVLAKLVWSDNVVIAGPVHIEPPFPQGLVTRARLRKSRDSTNDRTRPRRPRGTAWAMFVRLVPVGTKRELDLRRNKATLVASQYIKNTANTLISSFFSGDCLSFTL